jgi:predicted  nucleic acid-binding Zn-ribbon protein
VIPVKCLVPLQEFDLKIDAANASINEKKKKLVRMHKDIEADSELIAKKKALLQKIQLRKRAAENELASVSEKIKTSGDKQMSAGIDPSSYSALEKEIKALKDKEGELETAILEDMEKIETLEKDTAKGDKVVAGRKIHLQEVEGRINDEILALKKEIEIFKTQRSQIALKIDSDSLELYEDLRQQKKGRVIFDAEEASCPACGMSLPDGFVSSVSSHDEAEKCSYCDVLIHWTGQRI